MSESQHGRSTNTGEVSNFQHGPRGWWDYVPEASQSAWPGDSQAPPGLDGEKLPEHHNILQFMSRVRAGYIPESDQSDTKSRTVGRSSPYRKPSVTFSVGHSHSRFLKKDFSLRASVAPSVGSRISKYMPRMQLFREMLKNEVRQVVALLPEADADVV